MVETKEPNKGKRINTMVELILLVIFCDLKFFTRGSYLHITIQFIALERHIFTRMTVVEWCLANITDATCRSSVIKLFM